MGHDTCRNGTTVIFLAYLNVHLGTLRSNWIKGPRHIQCSVPGSPRVAAKRSAAAQMSQCVESLLCCSVLGG